jgi:hypothetical protein
MYDDSYTKNSFFIMLTSISSAGNYLMGLFVAAPNMILPIMVLNVLGAEEAAYYLAYVVASLLFMIPSAIGTSLFVEGSHSEALKRTVMKSLVATFSLLVPAAALLYVCGGWVLGVVGVDYAAGGAGVLRAMVGFGYVFMIMFGVVGVGYAWVGGVRLLRGEG